MSETGPSRSISILVDGFSHRFGGGLTYLGNLLPELARQPGLGPVRIVLEPDAVLARMLAGSEVVVEPVRLKPSGLAGRLRWEARMLDRYAGEAMVISPNAMLPVSIAAPVIAVPHNILPFIGDGLRNGLQRRAIVRTLRGATGVIFVSEEMRRQVRRMTPRPMIERVIPHGVAEAFRDATEPPRNRHGMICIADHYAHKRLDLLIEAWRTLGPDRPRLQVIGTPLQGAAVASDVTFRARLTPSELAHELRGAALVAVPSVAESFCLPALEALSCEAPLLLSDIPVLREVTGGHASYLDSASPAVWAQAMQRLLDAPPPTNHARRWARAFTWARTASATADIIREVDATSR